MAFTRADGSKSHIRVVTDYKHLGTRIASDDSLAPETTARAAAIRTTLAAISQRVLGNPHTPWGTKTLVTKLHILSKGLYQAGAWPTLQTNELKPIHGAIVGTCRRLTAATAAITNAQPLTEPELYAHTHLQAPLVIIIQARLLLFVRLALKATTRLWLQLSAAWPAKRSWLRAATEAFEYLTEHAPQFHTYKGASLQTWYELARAKPTALRTQITQALSHADMQERTMWTTTDAPQAPGQDLQCPCGYQAKSRAQLAVHAYTAHHAMRNVRSLSLIHI